MSTKDEIYCSFLLRIWIEPLDGDQWRFSLEDTQTGKRRGFTSLDELKRFLRDVMSEDCDAKEDL